jgi:hypothetical protein
MNIILTCGSCWLLHFYTVLRLYNQTGKQLYFGVSKLLPSYQCYNGHQNSQQPAVVNENISRVFL